MRGANGEAEIRTLYLCIIHVPGVPGGRAQGPRGDPGALGLRFLNPELFVCVACCVEPMSAAMFARSTTTRNAVRAARSFATAVDAAGLKVAAVDNGQPTAAVTLLVKAGSRYQPQLGVAHLLKNFAFKAS